MIIVYFMQFDWNMKFYVLQIRYLDVFYIGVNIGNVLKEVFIEWKLLIEYEVVLVIDNVFNMEIVVKIVDLYFYIGCFVYIVNLVC